MTKFRVVFYQDIIHTEWPRESLRPAMPLKDRAKIFLPFAALKGYEECLEDIRIKVEHDSSQAINMKNF